MQYSTVTVKSWNDLLAAYYTLDNYQFDWLFRGHSNAEWDLESTLERSLVRRFDLAYETLPKIEISLIRSFQRGCHDYVNNPPHFEDLLEWRALMQHHGAPTRLIDWSYSFYVAVYFASESMTHQVPGAIWAINQRWLIRNALALLSDETRELVKHDPRIKLPQTVDAVLASGPLVLPLNPYRLNERLRLQQGLFLAAADISRSFIDNLAVVTSGDGASDYFRKIVFQCDLAELKHTLMELRRMNLTAETLFPGIDGFAKGLHQKIAMRELEVRIADISIPLARTS